jgi:hypothetical protein
MGKWLQWIYSVFFAKGYEQGHEVGYVRGETEGRKFVELHNRYGSLENIPTVLLLSELPSQGESMVQRQLTKKALLRIDHLMEQCALEPWARTTDLLTRYLDFQQLLHEEQTQVSTLLKSPSRVGGLLMLAHYLDNFDVDAFMGKLIENGLMKDYQDSLKDDQYKVL